ncbi:MAG TPA: phosphoserine phosphatase SerB, partial [Gammaproteobacteria bacterium]|nr:phosphoserine phosphatase SerB [Gammaproteobacteria bacterium]
MKGLDISVLDKVYAERLQVNPGGQDLIEYFKSKGIKSAVVSGG